MHLKLSDFGTAKEIGREADARSNSFVGTAEYVSPELLIEKTTCKSSDLWAFGCIIYQMLCGRPPFRGATEFLTFEQIRSGLVEFPVGFPEVARDLVTRLLCLDPMDRLGARDTEPGYPSIRRHPFFSGIDFANIHTQTPPVIRPFPGKLVFGDALLADEEMKQKKMMDEETEKWRKFLTSEEYILETGLILKRKGRSVKKRQLILTSQPRVIYVDPKKMIVKGEVPWSPEIRAEAKNNIAWFIHTVRKDILQDSKKNNNKMFI
jgi:3-phosphoinositide dependent protein kinase-1